MHQVLCLKYQSEIDCTAFGYRCYQRTCQLEAECFTNSRNNFEQAASRQATILSKNKATSEDDKTKTVRNKHRAYET